MAEDLSDQARPRGAMHEGGLGRELPRTGPMPAPMRASSGAKADHVANSGNTRSIRSQEKSREHSRGQPRLGGGQVHPDGANRDDQLRLRHTRLAGIDFPGMDVEQTLARRSGRPGAARCGTAGRARAGTSRRRPPGTLRPAGAASSSGLPTAPPRRCGAAAHPARRRGRGGRGRRWSCRYDPRRPARPRPRACAGRSRRWAPDSRARRRRRHPPAIAGRGRHRRGTRLPPACARARGRSRDWPARGRRRRCGGSDAGWRSATQPSVKKVAAHPGAFETDRAAGRCWPRPGAADCSQSARGIASA